MSVYALTLIKEDGTGKADANAYADVADGDAYHAGHFMPQRGRRRRRIKRPWHW